jgi:hypothetical protein
MEENGSTTNRLGCGSGPSKTHPPSGDFARRDFASAAPKIRRKGFAQRRKELSLQLWVLPDAYLSTGISPGGCSRE